MLGRMTDSVYEYCVRSNPGIPPEMCGMLTAHYSNGSQRTVPPSEINTWKASEIRIAKVIASREAARMWGWQPPEGYVVRNAGSDLAEMMAVEPAHVYSGKPTIESWDWPGWACFCNWYFWLAPASRAELNQDIRAGNAYKWAFWAMHFRQMCPSSVAQDPAYLTADPNLLTQWDPAWKRNTASGAPSASPVSQEQAVFASPPPPWAPHPWPILSMIPGMPPMAIPGVPVPACEPFPQCVTQSLQGFGLPMPCQPFPSCMWTAAGIAAQTSPALAVTSRPDGWGTYQSAQIQGPPPADTSPKGIEWPRVALIVGGGLLAGIAIVAALSSPSSR
jgi:hypothetical protein